LVSIVSILILVIVTNREKSKINDLLSTNILTEGYIKDRGFVGGTSNIAPNFTYKIDDEIYENKFDRSEFCPNMSKSEFYEMKNNAFPVIYSKRNRTISKIILSLDIAKKYNVDLTNDQKMLLMKYFDCEYRTQKQRSLRKIIDVNNSN